MFDFARLGELLTGAGGATATDGLANVAEALTAAGIDPAVLESLDPAALTELLANLGLDPAAFDLSTVIDGVQEHSGGVLGELQSFLGQRDL
jgi:acetyl-CoA acetyltransferase